jgi:hypothetical protein
VKISENRMRELLACASEAGDKDRDIKRKAAARFRRESLKALLEVEAIELIGEYRQVIETRPRPVMPPPVMTSRLPRLRVPRPPTKSAPAIQRDPTDLRGAPPPPALAGYRHGTDFSGWKGVWESSTAEEFAEWEAMPCNKLAPPPPLRPDLSGWTGMGLFRRKLSPEVLERLKVDWEWRRERYERLNAAHAEKHGRPTPRPTNRLRDFTPQEKAWIAANSPPVQKPVDRASAWEPRPKTPPRRPFVRKLLPLSPGWVDHVSAPLREYTVVEPGGALRFLAPPGSGNRILPYGWGVQPERQDYRYPDPMPRSLIPLMPPFFLGKLLHHEPTWQEFLAANPQEAAYFAGTSIALRDAERPRGPEPVRTTDAEDEKRDWEANKAATAARLSDGFELQKGEHVEPEQAAVAKSVDGVTDPF